MKSGFPTSCAPAEPKVCQTDAEEQFILPQIMRWTEHVSPGLEYATIVQARQ